MHEDPRIDRHRGAVYRAEDLLASVMASRHRMVRVRGAVRTLPTEVWFGELDAMQAFVDGALAHPATTARYPEAGPVRVEPRRGHRRATYRDGVIGIPSPQGRGRWAMARGVALHELAHHLAGEPGHGPAFREALLHLTAEHVGVAAADLLRELFAPLDALPDAAAVDAGEAGGDQVRRVAALLAKAAATDAPQEAEAYLAKAALVAQRHSIDLAVAAMGRPQGSQAPTHRMLTIGAPRKPLNTLLVSLYVAIARAWSVRVDIGAGSTYVLGYGMPRDLDQVEAVFATASTVMVSGAEAHVRGGSWRGSTYRTAGSATVRPVTATVARNAFCVGFVELIGERMAQAGVRARGEAHDGAGSPAAGAGQSGQGGPTQAQVALALRARDVAVHAYHRSASQARGSWRGSATAAGSATGSRRAGQRAAEAYGRRGVEGGRPALGA